MKKNYKYSHINPFNTKNDIFNLLHDIYDGYDLGTSSIKKLFSDYSIPYKYRFKIINFLSKFINVDIIDHANGVSHTLLDSTWFIDGIDLLEQSVLSPKEYLEGDTFKLYQELPENVKIIKHFNSSTYTE